MARCAHSLSLDRRSTLPEFKMTGGFMRSEARTHLRRQAAPFSITRAYANRFSCFQLHKNFEPLARSMRLTNVGPTAASPRKAS